MAQTSLRYGVKLALSRLLIAPQRLISSVSEPLTRLHAFVVLNSRLGGVIDPTVVLLGAPEVRGTARIRLGRNLLLYREIYLETQADGEIEIGDEVVVSRGTHLVSWERITIGRGTMIGEYCSVRDADHRFGSGQRLRSAGHVASAITIGSDVWIGRGCAVLAGVTIGDRAVIGANSVVTRDIPPGAVAFGAPARVHRLSEVE